MRKVLAFMHNARSDQVELATKVCSILGSVEVETYNIPQHRVEDHINHNSIVLTFGTFAGSSASQHIEEKQVKNVQLLKLPHLKYLKSHQDNTDTRASTFKKLQDLKELLGQDVFLPTEVVVTEKDLPDLSAKQIAMLKEMTEKRNQDTCFQTSKGGKLIEISCTPHEKSKADLQFTFEELHMIRIAMDVLQVKEVTFVRNSKKDSN